jgi:hypothetical protein
MDSILSPEWLAVQDGKERGERRKEQKSSQVMQLHIDTAIS